MLDHFLPPPSILTQGEHGGQAVVASGEAGEK
jgi:hypothetical protein